MKKEIITLNEERRVTLSAYLQEEQGDKLYPAILVMPGGGYAICADGEGEPPAFAWQKAGFQAFVLRYTVGKRCHWPLPLKDYEQAMAVILERAEQWHIDPKKIAVAGFSAGGHLAACAATLADTKPAAAVLIYPAIPKETIAHCLPDAPGADEYVTEETCPCFFAAARDDDDVDIRSTLIMEKALADHGVPFESHIYNIGGHAFSTGESSPWGHALSPRLKHWVEESIGWLRETLEL